MLKLSSMLLSIFAVLLLAGCAAQQDMRLTSNFWNNNSKKIVVSKTTVPSASLYKEGPQGLLDVAVTAGVTHQFVAYLQKVDIKPNVGLEYAFKNKFCENNITAVINPNLINRDRLPPYGNSSPEFTDKDYSSLTSQFGNNVMLLVQVKSWGATRPYYGFIPLGPPKAFCSITGELFSMSDNRVLWRHNSNVAITVQGSWDQPPSYPNFTQALRAAVSEAQADLLNNL